jgi:hypothetical protein
MVIHLKITSNYWALSENEYLFEFYQKQNGYEIAAVHWFVSENSGVDDYVKEARKTVENSL